MIDKELLREAWEEGEYYGSWEYAGTGDRPDTFEHWYNKRVGKNEFYTLLCAARDMLTNIKRCGDFYFRAIELDRHLDNPINGEDLEKDIDKLLEMINERCT